MLVAGDVSHRLMKCKTIQSPARDGMFGLRLHVVPLGLVLHVCYLSGD